MRMKLTPQTRPPTPQLHLTTSVAPLKDARNLFVGRPGKGAAVHVHTWLRGTPGNSMAEAEQWAAGISGPAYAMDDETAIKVVDGTVEVVSEGHWKHFPS